MCPCVKVPSEPILWECMEIRGEGEEGKGERVAKK